MRVEAHDPRTLIVLGVDPVRIDVLKSIDGVPPFAAAWKRRVDGLYGAAPTHYIAVEDLIASKRAASRPQDLADLDVLTHAAKGSRT